MTPVAVILYLRPEHARRTLQALSQNYLAKETEVYVFINVPDKLKATAEEIKSNNAVVSTAKSFKDCFCKYHVIIREKFLECNDSICGAVDDVLYIHNKVIVLEDDIETRRNFLNYMNEALDYYADDNTVWNISGYCPIVLSRSHGDVFRACSFMPWGWGVWKDRWAKVDWKRKRDNLLKLDFSFLRKNMPLFDLAARRDILTGNRPMYWDYIYSLTQARLKMDTIFPTESLVYNFGNDGTGETELDGIQDYDCSLKETIASKRTFDFIEHHLSDKEREEFTEYLYYRQKRSPMDKEAYNKRFWFYIWLRLKLHKASLAEYLKEKNIEKLAVYGMGYAGELLCEELHETCVEVRYVMDRSGKSVVKNIPVLSLYDDLPEVDMVIVTVTRSFAEIAKILAMKISCETTSFEDLIFDWALHEKLWEK